MKKSVRFQILSIVSLKLNSKYSFGVKCNVKDQAAVQNSHEPTISSSLLLVTTVNKHQRSSEGVERNRITSQVITQSFKTSKKRLVNNVKEKPLSEYTGASQ